MGSNMKLVKNVCHCYLGFSVDDLSIDVLPDPLGETSEAFRAGTDTYPGFYLKFEFYDS